MQVNLVLVSMKSKTKSLFSKDALDKLRRDRFTGMLMVQWDNGVIKDLNLKTSFRYFCGDDFFVEE